MRIFCFGDSNTYGYDARSRLGERLPAWERWPEILKDGDPYYNPNLTLRKSNFALRDLKKEKIGEPYHLEV